MRLQTSWLALVLLAPLVSRATPDFPEAIGRDLHLSAPPACTICHATDQGGVGTVVKPFGKYLRSRGLAPFDESSLAGALAAAQGERHDSDGDGVTDIEALQRGLDPNGSSSGAPRIEDPTFGCSSTRDGAENTLLLALVVGLRLAAGHICRLRGRTSAAGQPELEGVPGAGPSPRRDDARLRSPTGKR